MRRTASVLVFGTVLAAGASRPAGAAAVCDSNLMIVLDRSCSMDNAVGNGEPRTKWVVAEEAIAALTTTYAGKLRFGLIMFPDQTGVDCQQDGPIYVNVGPGTEAAVQMAIAGTDPTGPCVTNIDTAIGQVATDPAFGPVADPSGRRSFVLLVSDGKQSSACGGDARDPVTITNIEALYTAGYPTYVVGFGGGVDPADLNDFALAGGVPRAGDPKYFQADSAAELQLALETIAGSIVGDPELGTCAGTPCPDGRCTGTWEVCTDGACVVYPPDAGPEPDGGSGGDDDGGAGDDGGGPGGGGDPGGVSTCGCRAGARGGSAGAGLLVALTLVAVRRRRR